MKTLRIFSIVAFFMATSNLSIAQAAKKETIKVSGECNMCKNKIEAAAKNAGAVYALWNVNTKMLTVKYNSVSTNMAKIQQTIAGVGYDTPEFKTTLDAYYRLDLCCQYQRDAVNNTEGCCKDSQSCKAMSCCSDKCEMKEGKCTDQADCKEKGCCKN